MASKKYIPSNKIKQLIIAWEGSSIKTNRSFEAEARDFQRYLEKAGIYDLMSQDELDGLFSYSYNVGSGTFSKRTLPHLIKLYNGTGSLENVLNNIYGTRDSEPQMSGLRTRRKYEKDLFTKGYNQRINKNKNKPKYSVYQQEATPVVQPLLDLDQLLNNYSVTALWEPNKTMLDQYTDYWTNNIPQVEYLPLELKTFNPIFSNRIFSIYYNGGKLLKKVNK